MPAIWDDPNYRSFGLSVPNPSMPSSQGMVVDEPPGYGPQIQREASVAPSAVPARPSAPTATVPERSFSQPSMTIPSPKSFKQWYYEDSGMGDPGGPNPNRRVDLARAQQGYTLYRKQFDQQARFLMEQSRMERFHADEMRMQGAKFGYDQQRDYRKDIVEAEDRGLKMAEYKARRAHETFTEERDLRQDAESGRRWEAEQSVREERMMIEYMKASKEKGENGLSSPTGRMAFVSKWADEIGPNRAMWERLDKRIVKLYDAAIDKTLQSETGEAPSTQPAAKTAQPKKLHIRLLRTIPGAGPQGSEGYIDEDDAAFDSIKEGEDYELVE